MQIRLATVADIPVLIALESDAVTAAHWSSEQYESAISDAGPVRVLLVLEEERVIQAFLAARAVEHEWEIENIAVTGQARRQGLGTRLLGEFLNIARGQGGKAVYLEVRESNHAARGLYEKWAFVESGRRTRYYNNPLEDAITYRLDLP
jgi:ribosomal-protein-alanine N-acetyltransferase